MRSTALRASTCSWSTQALPLTRVMPSSSMRFCACSWASMIKAWPSSLSTLKSVSKMTFSAACAVPAHRPTATSSAQLLNKPCMVIHPQKLLLTVHQFRRQGDDQEAAEDQAAGEKPQGARAAAGDVDRHAHQRVAHQAGDVRHRAGEGKAGGCCGALEKGCRQAEKYRHGADDRGRGDGEQHHRGHHVMGKECA